MIYSIVYFTTYNLFLYPMLSLICLLFIYNCDTCKNYIYNIYNDYNDLYNMFKPTVKPNIFLYIHYTCIKTIIKKYLYSLIKYFKNQEDASLVKINNKLTMLTYTLHNKQFKILIVSKKNPYEIKITDETEKDITNIILPYLGPNLDLHNQSNITPRLLSDSCSIVKFNKLNFHINDEVLSFNEYDVIDLNI